MVEDVRGRREVCSPDDLLLLFRQVSGEALDAFRKHPGSTVGDFDVGENIGSGELVLLTLRRFVDIRGKCGDVDQPGNVVVRSRGCDDGSALRVADEDGRAAHLPECALDCGDVAFE